MAASVADAAAVNPNGIKALLASGLSTFSLNAIQFLVMLLKVYLKILLIVLFYSIEELFAKTLRRFETCVLVNNNL